MNKVGTKDWFNSEEKVNSYRGLPNSYVLMTVFGFVSSEMKHSSLSALIQFQEFTITLMRIRLNLSIADLAYRFAISTSTTSADILKWINIYNRLEVMFTWPSQDDLFATTTMSFNHHFKTKVAFVISTKTIWQKQKHFLHNMTTIDKIAMICSALPTCATRSFQLNKRYWRQINGFFKATNIWNMLVAKTKCGVGGWLFIFNCFYPIFPRLDGASGEANTWTLFQPKTSNSVFSFV